MPTTKRHTKSKAKTKPVMALPKPIRDELRMSVALRGYSVIKGGDGKTMTQQEKLLEDFFHGKKKHSPSQIQMLVNGQLHYASFYEKQSAPISSKKKKLSKKNKVPATDTYILKQSLSRNDSRIFVQNIDITVKDLEKKLLSGTDIVHGRQLLAMAKKGLK